MRFRKKPLEVEAMRVPGDVETDYMAWGAISIWLGAGGPWEVADDNGIDVHTLEGTMHAQPGDWIIREPFPTGTRIFYPCKPDIFESTYEALE